METEEKLKESDMYPHAYTDFVKSCDYHETAIKNAMIAALDLSRYPDANKNKILSIVLIYKKDWENYPAHRRFHLECTSSVHRDPSQNDKDVPQMLVQAAQYILNAKENDNYTAYAKEILGEEFYGFGRFAIIGAFRLPNGEIHQFRVIKKFAIEKIYTKAQVNSRWKMLLEDYIRKGNKIRVYWGKKKSDKCCCCGGRMYE